MGRRNWQFGFLSAGILALASAMGCQPDTSSTNNAGTAGSSGSTNTGGDTGGTNPGGTNPGGTGPGGGGTNPGGGGSGGSTTTVDPCLDGATDATVYDVTKGNVGVDIKVKVDGVIAMSHKHLISHSNSGSCLWGVFVSAPDTEAGQQLTETAEYSGVIVLSYGDMAPPDTPCPTGTDSIKDDVKPGDVLDVVGTTSKFILNTCGQKPEDSDIPQTQLFKSCKAEKVGTAAVPAPHVLSDAEITALATQTGAEAQKTHQAWGGVKVRAEMVDVDPWILPPKPDSIVGPFGIVKLAPGGLNVADGLYYEQGSAEVCKTGPNFDFKYQLPFMFDYVQGFHHLAFCTWGLSNEDKCADFSLPSPDCSDASINACYLD